MSENDFVSTAAWACIEFLHEKLNHKRLHVYSGSQQPLGLVLSFYNNGMPGSMIAIMRSQQPLGLVLSFYLYRIKFSDTKAEWEVSTAAWACIEFLRIK